MKKFISFFLTIALILGNSCSLVQYPELYDEEIRDAVKYHIAVADYIVNLASNPFCLIGIALFSNEFEQNIENLDSEIKEIYTNTDMNYRQVLQYIANDNTSNYQDDAEKMLTYYNALNVSLTNYTEVSSSLNYDSWTFKEVLSGIEFIFEIHDPDDGNTTWTCSPVQKSIKKYIQNQIN